MTDVRMRKFLLAQIAGWFSLELLAVLTGVVSAWYYGTSWSFAQDFLYLPNPAVTENIVLAELLSVLFWMSAEAASILHVACFAATTLWVAGLTDPVLPIGDIAPFFGDGHWPALPIGVAAFGTWKAMQKTHA